MPGYRKRSYKKRYYRKSYKKSGYKKLNKKINKIYSKLDGEVKKID